MESRKLFFLVTHDTAGADGLLVVHKAAQGEVEHVVAGPDEDGVSCSLASNCSGGQLDIFYCAQAGFVGGGAVVEDGDSVSSFTGPVPENVGDFVVGDYNLLVYRISQVVDDPVQDGLAPNVQ